jgi:hypothetical protein
VKIAAEPLAPSGFVFEKQIVDGTVAKEYLPGVEKGLESVLGSGVLAGFAVVELKVSLVDARIIDVDSSELAFEIATRMALQRGASQFCPIMKVEYTGLVIADLRRRQNLQVRFLVLLRPPPPDAQRRRCRRRHGASAQNLRRVARAYGRRRLIHHCPRWITAALESRRPRHCWFASVYRPDSPLNLPIETQGC